MQIKNFPNYSCDENGNVFSKGKKLKQAKRNGYLGVTLCNSGFKKSDYLLIDENNISDISI